MHDARLLAIFIDDPKKITAEQMDSWANDFDSWDICDQACTSLFDQSPFAYEKVYKWSDTEKEFVKRAAFSLIAGVAVHDKKKTPDEQFISFLDIIKKQSTDE
ncbi:MAG: DNA alkylation repair protein, partial [Candidatus Thermoplasmatota archaeon]|nr:DNA alkylation repair protein [Candidatus Thermoplasmatota archaeon]